MQGFYARQLATGGLILAPMAGYSDAPFRAVARELGAAWTVSEMMSARGVVNGDATLDLGRPLPGERDRVIQLFGADSELLAEASARLYQLFCPEAIDLNLGCPVPKVRGRGGSCLLQTPERAYGLVSAMRAAVPCDISAKMRLGWDIDRSVEIAQGLAEAGADLIAVHGRTAAQRYEGQADWNAIAQVAASVPVPVVGSGDVTSVEQAQEKRRLGVAGVMVGRGATGNPWIFRQARGGTAPGEDERVEVALRHAALNIAFYGERTGLRQLRKVLPRYFPARPEWRDSLVRVDTLAGLRQVLGCVDVAA
ncbi:tRNA dihydrouridine synthase [Deinococcus peraridilitoris]|uniref:tRNA-dihydrouridine synthase n=1 Tax=Deinococcus peraridilitoris (strain DSM 19664 / LMG 22246 / CIP 109416 / KR-200) TaxID=937777 RepID=L0A3Y3_DEIPD|nr:tRNA-dihydrouridine synthase family protein [Deinococcus peraridilitoris]AFZ67907.1 tRNA-dihydrouridine synthase [Deinococcus peraridilitoris DSM 19664]